MNEASDKKGRRTTDRIEITKTRIDALTVPPGVDRAFLRDSKIVGFGVCKYASGKTVFTFGQRIDGRPVRKVIGEYGPLTVQAAREAAAKLALAVDGGSDPFEARERVKKEPTFSEFAEIYLERHARPHKVSAGRDAGHLRRYFSILENKKISRITRQDISTLHLFIGENHGHYMANRCLALVRKMFNLALEWGVLPESHGNPATRIRAFREEKRDRFLSPREIERFFEAVRTEPDPVWRAFFLLLVFTGVRKSELLSARWEDFDLDGQTWRIPKTKAGRPHILPLTGPVINLLSQLPSYGKDSWLFPSFSRSGHREEPRRPWEQIRRRAGIEEVRIHDLRRTLASWMAVQGFSLNLIGRVLNHSQVSTTQIYARLGTDPQREALEAVQGKMLESMGSQLTLNEERKK